MQNIGPATKTIIIMLAMSISAHVYASDFGNHIGVAYLTKQDNTKIYSSDTGDETDTILSKNFMLVAWDTRGTLHAMSGNPYVIAQENSSNGRFHIRYFKNGKDSGDGENTAWVNPTDVQRFTFDCCGDRLCSGVKPRIFASTVYSDCLISGRDKQLEAKTPLKQADDIEKLKLQIELERIKLEREKLNSSEKSK